MKNDTYNDIEGYDESNEGPLVYYAMNLDGMCYSIIEYWCICCVVHNLMVVLLTLCDDARCCCLLW